MCIYLYTYIHIIYIYHFIHRKYIICPQILVLANAGGFTMLHLLKKKKNMPATVGLVQAQTASNKHHTWPQYLTAQQLGIL